MAGTVANAVAQGRKGLRGDRRRAAPWYERVIEAILLGCGVLSVLVTIGILFVLLRESVAFFSDVTFVQFFGDTEWTPLFAEKHFGIWPLVSGTLLTASIAVAVSLPFGLMAAIYLSEYASARQRKIIKPTLELLAGVPTIVYGYFALVFMTPLLQQFVPGLSGFNALSAGIVMGVMIMPMISSISEDAIYAVPQRYREGSLALGASKLATTLRVTVPAAFSGIAASITLAISRAIGETMIVTIAAGQRPQLTLDPRVPINTMTAYIVSIAKGDTPTGTVEYRTIFAVGTMLFLMTFVMNLISHRLTRGVRSAHEA